MPRREANAKILNEIAADCLAVRLRLVNRAVTAVYDEALRPFGVRTSQVNILVAVGAAGGTRPADLCGILQLDPSTLSRNVERMRARKWIETVPSADGRSHTLKLTAQGRELIRSAYPAWQRAQRDAAEMLGGGAAAVMAAGDGFMAREMERIYGKPGKAG